jgi:crotonobetainyl-CoA:carnitine CoA-transferase CaiB-like acyl-CoA transferase
MGQDGPRALVPGHDLNYQAWAGALAPDGGPPAIGALPIADLAGGMAAAMAICAAVVRRLRTGEGERIDVAMTDVLATWTGAATARSSLDPEDGGDGGRGVPGYGTFATVDGRHLVLGVLNEERFWRSLCDVLGLDDLGDAGFAERLGRAGELQARVAAAIAPRERDELVAALLAADVPVAPVHDRDGMLADEHLRARGVVTSDPWAPVATGHPVTLVHHPARRTAPPPALDEHRGAGFAPRRS